MDDQRDAQLRQQVAAMTHELGNLLGAVSNFSTLLARRLSDPGPLADIDRIQEATKRAGELVRELAAVAATGRDRADG